MSTDELDLQIVQHLLKDGRAPYSEIGRTVGLSVSATKRRVDRLVDEDVIRGFTAVVDANALGWRLSALVQLFTTGTVPAATMRRDLDQISEVVTAFTVSGGADAVLRVVASDVTHLERVISRLRALPYVQQTDTTMLLSNLLSRPSLEPPGDPL